MVCLYYEYLVNFLTFDPLPCSRKSFACQEGLDVHVNPVEVSCQYWLVTTINLISIIYTDPDLRWHYYSGKNLLKKNILRHQREHCHLSSA